MKIGFIGQGWIGKNYALDFEERGFEVTRYSKEPEYEKNKDVIALCDIVFIAVPTPTTPAGFDDSYIHATLPLVGPDKVAVIKSTMPPGLTKKLQVQYPNITLLFSPEFLSEATAKHDVSNPFANIVGMAEETPKHRNAAETILSILPKAPLALICKSEEAEIFKYTHNVSGFVQIVFFNMMYDLAASLKCDWSVIHKAILADPLIANRYAEPLHKSGRGAGGHCFIKDFSAFENIYKQTFPNDDAGKKLLAANSEKNIDLLVSTGKDMDILSGVYGGDIIKK